jgi:PAS domain S-box-containing protein
VNPWIEGAVSINERQFFDAMAFSAIGTALVALDGRWLWTNSAIQTLLGYSSDELSRTTYQEITFPDDLDADLELSRQLLAGKIAAYQMEKRYIRKDGALIWCKLSVSLVRDDAGEAQHFISHVQDVSERKRTEVEREELIREAHAASAAKSSFLANMSHEIRTPLNGVLGMAQVMAADELTETQRGRLEVIRESGDALLAILNDILDLSKIEAGKLDLEEVPFDLGELLRMTHRSFALLAHQKGLELILDIGDADGVYRGDPTRVRQVLSNFLSNAIKFTQIGQICIEARARSTGFELSVSDTGLGISPAAVERIFSKFSQADVSTTREHGGTGLGLSICSELVAMMGGEISVTSARNVGSTFRASFAAPRLGDTIGPEIVARAPLLPECEMRVLVVEDNSVNQLVVKTMLLQAGVEALVVADGQQAVSAWKEHAWAAILMDVQMPIMDGVTATRQIRLLEQAQQRRRTPIIGLTANAMPHQTVEYIAAGMDSCVAKPIEAAALLKALANALDAVEETPSARQSA